MKLLAALSAAIAAFGIVTGILDWKRPRPTPVRQRGPRARGRLQRRLDEAGAGVSAGRYRTTVAGTVVLVALVIYAATGTAALAIPPSLAVGLTPRLYFQRRHTKVLQERRTSWPEAIRDVLANLATGQTLHRSLCMLGHAGPQPLRAIWLRYERNAAALDPATALDLARAELADPVSDRVIEAFGAAQEHGREVIVAVLRSLADNVTKDLQLVEQIATSQTEIRSQAVVAVILPFGVLAFLVASNDGYRSFYQSSAGWVVVSIGVLMALGGWKLITVLGRIPTEPRVLAKSGARR